MLAALLAFLCLLVAVHSQAPAVSLVPTSFPGSSTFGGTSDVENYYMTPSGTSAPLLAVGDNAILTLQYAWIDDKGSLVSWNSSVWESNLVLPTLIQLGNDSALIIQSVTVRTSCAKLLAIQDLACKDLEAMDRLTAVQIVARDMLIPSWDSSRAQITNLRITCRQRGDIDPLIPSFSPALPPSSPGVIPSQEDRIICGVAYVHNWTELSVAAETMQPYAAKTIIVPVVNISVGNDNSGDIPVYSDVTVQSLDDKSTWLDFGYLSGKGTWTMTDNARLTFRRITFLTLPLGPYDKFPWSTLGWPLWMVNMDRCQQDRQQLFVINCTLVMPPETMDYMSHWVSQLTSPFPDIAAAASWYATDYTCNPPDDNPYLLNQLRLISQRYWVTENATGFGTRFTNTVFTDTLPKNAVVTVAPLQLTKLFSDPYMPFPDIAWVETASQLLQELVAGTAPAIVMLTNISISKEHLTPWPQQCINISNKVKQVSGWPGRITVLDLQRIPDVFALTSQLQLRNLVLMNGAQDSLGHDGVPPTWAQNLTMLQWSFHCDGSLPLLQLTDVTLILPPTEFTYLITSAAAHSSNANSGEAGTMLQIGRDGVIRGTGVPGAFWGATGALKSGRVSVGVLVEDGWTGFNVTLMSQPPDGWLPFPNINITVVVDEFTGWPPPPASSTPAQDNDTILIIAIAVPVCFVILFVTLITTAVWRRRMQLRERSTMTSCPPTPDPVKACVTPSLGAIDEGKEVASDWASNSGASTAASGIVVLPHALATPTNATNIYLHTPARGGSSGPMSTGRTTMPTPYANGGAHGAGGADGLGMGTAARVLHWDGNVGGKAGGGVSGLASSPSATTLLLSPQTAGGTTNSIPRPPVLGPAPAFGPPSGGLTSDGILWGSWSMHEDSAMPHGSGLGNGLGNGHGNSSGLMGRSNFSPPAAQQQGMGFSADDGGSDSFDLVPEHHEQLLINRFDLSEDLQASMSAPDMASQLKAMVSNMQNELGDQEVEVTRVIGQGGGGVVYQGTWRGLTVAVKTMTFCVIPMQPMSRRQHRAMNEAAICKTLQHPNIVATYAYDVHALTPAFPSSNGNGGMQGGHNSTSSGSRETRGISKEGGPGGQHNPVCATEFKLFIVQEYCDGGALKGAIEDGKLHDRTSGTPKPVMAHILQLATDVAAGMSHVHSRCVVHGDLTPANVLLKPSPSTESGYVAKVADFGLSWKLAHGQAHVSNARQGTSFYIAPEVLHVGIMSKAADVFSFGMLLHEMYHGEPFWRNQSLATASAAVCRPGIEQLTWAPDCPPDYKALVCACVASDPQTRPTMFSVVEQLLNMQRQLWTQDGAGEGAGITSGTHAQSPQGNQSRSVARTSSTNVSRTSVRQPTSGFLHEVEVKAVYQAVRSTSTLQRAAQEGVITGVEVRED